MQSNSNAKDRFEYHDGLEYHHIKEYNEDNIRFDNYWVFKMFSKSFI